MFNTPERDRPNRLLATALSFVTTEGTPITLDLLGRQLDAPAWERPHLHTHFTRTSALPGVRRMFEEEGLELPGWAA